MNYMMSRKLSFSDAADSLGIAISNVFLFPWYSRNSLRYHFQILLRVRDCRLDGLWLALVFASAHFLHSDRVPNPAVEGPFAPAIA